MTNVTEKVVDEVTDQVDAADVVTGGNVAEQVDGDRLGRAVGEAVGALVGRQLGDLVVGRLASKLGMGDDDEPPTRSGKALRALAIALARTLQQPEIRDSVESSVRQLVADREAALGAGETAEDESEEGETDEAETEEGDEGETTAADVDPEMLQSLKRDTYRDLLDRMDYSELQSLAKDSGVKANMKRDDLIDGLVEKFGDENAEESSEGESGEEAETDEEEETNEGSEADEESEPDEEGESD